MQSSGRDESASPILDALLGATLSREKGSESLQRQLHRQIRGAILGGQFPSGSRLPGSRMLAVALGISRNSVTAVYEQLGAEGYVESDRQGTRVAALQHPSAQSSARAKSRPPDIAERSLHIRERSYSAPDTLALRPGVPALARFPIGAWKNCLDRVIQRAGTDLLGYGDPLGEMPLRTAIMRHLAISRGVRCEPEQVVITEGAQEALALCVRLVTNPGDIAWVEDPGYRGAQAALACGDLKMVPISVDAEGLRVSAQAWKQQCPRLIYATPSHQYPTGAVLSAARRLKLIREAQAHGAWIIEDDYDSEFRHAGAPIGAMQGMVAQAPVLYVGTFSKTLFPALRTGFLVLPETLIDTVAPVLRATLRGGHRHEQLALANFIESGQFGRHLGRMRRLYRKRQALLREALHDYLDVPHTVMGGESGMHLTIRLSEDYPDQRIVESAQSFGIAPAPLSQFFLGPSHADNGLVLGYGNTSESTFVPLIQRLNQVILWGADSNKTDHKSVSRRRRKE